MAAGRAGPLEAAGAGDQADAGPQARRKRACTRAATVSLPLGAPGPSSGDLSPAECEAYLARQLPGVCPACRALPAVCSVRASADRSLLTCTGTLTVATFPFEWQPTLVTVQPWLRAAKPHLQLSSLHRLIGWVEEVAGNLHHQHVSRCVCMSQEPTFPSNNTALICYPCAGAWRQ